MVAVSSVGLYFCLYIVVWFVVKVITLVTLRVCERCEESCILYVGKLGATFAFTGILSLTLLSLKEVYPAWSLLPAVSVVLILYLSDRKSRSAVK